MSNSHGEGKQTKFNVLIPRAINTVARRKTTSLTPNPEPEHKSRVALVGFAASTLSCLIQPAEASEFRRSTDEIPVSRRRQEAGKQPIARAGGIRGPLNIHRGLKEREFEPTSSITPLGHSREQWRRTERQHERTAMPNHQHAALWSSSFTSVKICKN